MSPTRLLLAGLLALSTGSAVLAAPSFVNALVLDARASDASGSSAVNDGRLGYFSDLYYDPQRDEWWALSDRGPGGGTLHYETRLHRFRVDVNPLTGGISNFQVLRTLIFRQGGAALDGFAPPPGEPLGMAFDPEGVVVGPRNGHFLVSDEYGPALLEINAAGQRVRGFQTPPALLPRDAATGRVNFASDAGNTAGKRTNRGFEGLAIGPDGRHAYAMLQSAMLDEGGGDGVYDRIVKFDTTTGRAVAQYAYRMEGASQGRGISALVALNDHEFLVLERDNRSKLAGSTPNLKRIYKIDLSKNGLKDVTDVSNVASLPEKGADLAALNITAVPKTLFIDMLKDVYKVDATHTIKDVIAEKMEALAWGPDLPDGRHVLYVLSDNDLNPGIPTQIYAFAVDGAAAGITYVPQDLPEPMFPPGQVKKLVK